MSAAEASGAPHPEHSGGPSGHAPAGGPGSSASLSTASSGSTDASRTSPDQPIAIERLDADTVGRVIAVVQRSEDTEALFYREAEIDALWSLADVASWSGQAAAESALILLWEAHEAVGHARPAEAVDALRRLQAQLEREPAGRRA